MKNTVNQSNVENALMPTGFGAQEYKRIDGGFEDAESLAILNDNFWLITGEYDELVIDGRIAFKK